MCCTFISTSWYVVMWPWRFVRRQQWVSETATPSLHLSFRCASDLLHTCLTSNTEQMNQLTGAVTVARWLHLPSPAPRSRGKIVTYRAPSSIYLMVGSIYKTGGCISIILHLILYIITWVFGHFIYIWKYIVLLFRLNIFLMFNWTIAPERMH